MVSAEQLLAALEQKGLLRPQLLQRVRQQIAQSAAPISAAALAKQLVEQGYLQKAQVEHLLGPAPAKPPPLDKKAEPSGSVTLDPSADSSSPFDLLDAEFPSPAPAAKDAGPGAAAAPHGKTSKRAPLEPHAKSANGIDAGVNRPPLEQLPPAPRRRFPLDAGRKRVLYVGIGLLAAILGIVAIGILLVSRSGDAEELKEADAAYQAGNFAQAAAAYDRFLEKSPRGAAAGQARVHRGLCRLHQATSGNPDWPVAAAIAAHVVAEIGPEPALNDARKELGSQLAAIADGLAGRVRNNPAETSMAETRRVLDLISHYVPRSQRNRALVSDVEVVLAIAQRRIDRPGEIDKTIAAIQQAAGQGKPQEVYALRTALLKSYPDLAAHVGLREALRSAAQAEKEAVKKVDRKQPASRVEAAGPIAAVLTFAARHYQADAPALAGQVLLAVVHGAAFAIDAATGNPLWRRYVGIDDVARAELDPCNPADQPPGDWILLDSARQEVLRVDARSGRLRWRHPLGEEAAARPAVAAGKVLVPTRSGLLAIIDLAAGDAAGAIRFPQPLSAAAVLDPSRSLVFLVGRQQQIYVVSLADGQCKQVFALEHAPGSVSAPPVVCGGLLLVAVNDRLGESTLHVLRIGAGDSAPLAPLEQIRLRGHVDVAPQCAHGRVAVATDCGAVYLFESSEGEAAKSIRQVAGNAIALERNSFGYRAPGGTGISPVLDPEGVLHFPIFDGNRLWVADTQCTAYDLGPDRRLTATARSQPQGTFQQPLAVSGRVLFHARHRDGFSGLVVTAVDAADGKTYWETSIGAPLASGILVDAQGGTLTAATTAGALFRIDAAGVKDLSIVDRPLAAWATDAPVAALSALDCGGLVLAGGSQSTEVALRDTAHYGPAFQRLQLPDVVTTPPIAFAGGLLAAGSAGQVLLCDGQTGRMVGEPFQPVLAAGTRCSWTAPVPAGKDRFVIADGRNKLYLVGLKSGPQPRLFELARVTTPARIDSPLAIAAGKAMYAVDAAGTLTAFALKGLQRDAVWTLGDRCTWGPWAAGDRVLLLSGLRKFWCLDGDAKLLWQKELPYGPPVGAPLVAGDHVLLAFARGMVCRIDGASGKELSAIDTGQTLANGPALLGRRLFVGTLDGSLLEIRQP